MSPPATSTRAPRAAARRLRRVIEALDPLPAGPCTPPATSGTDGPVAGDQSQDRDDRPRVRGLDPRELDYLYE